MTAVVFSGFLVAAANLVSFDQEILESIFVSHLIDGSLLNATTFYKIDLYSF